METPGEHPTTLFVRNLKPVTTKSDLDNHFGGVGPLRRTLIVTDHSTGLCKGFGFVHYALAEDAKSALTSLNGSMLHGRRISLHFARPRQRDQHDEDGGLAPRAPRPKDKPGKQIGKLKGAPAMRTVLLRRKNGQALSEDDAQAAFGEDRRPESFLLVAKGKEARCTFGSWSEAGKAAAIAHEKQYDACVEALKGGKNTRLIVRNLPFRVNVAELRNAFAKYAAVREVRLEPPRALKGKLESRTDKPDNGVDFVQCAGFGFVEYFLVADAKFALAKLNGAKIGGRVVAVDLALGKSDYAKRIAGEEDEDSGRAIGNDEDIEEGDVREESNSDCEGGSSSSESGEHEPEVVSDESEEGKGRDGSFAESSRSKMRRPTLPKKAPASTEAEMARTVFVRNLLFETSAPELWKAMAEEFGPVEQAVLVRDRVTGRPRGTAFVRFSSKVDAEKAVQQAGAGDTSKMRSALAGRQTGGFVLQGRQLMLSKAVDRARAKDLTESASGKVKKDDPRNLRLAWIGRIKPGTPEARGLSEADLTRRAKSDREKKTKLSRNPNAFVSDVRLSVRNIPKDFEDKLLKQMFLIAAGGSPHKTRESKSELEEEKKDVPGNLTGRANGECRPQPRITYCKIIRDAQRKDRSKGYGFVQFEKHEHALAALHRVNNNAKALDMLITAAPKILRIDEHRERLLRKQWGDGRRLQVDFSVEDRRIVQVLERVKEKGKQLSQAQTKKKAEEGTDEQKSPSKSSKKRKRSADAKEHEQNVKSEKKMSKSEKRSALKRKRGEGTESYEGGSKRARSTVKNSLGSKGTQGDSRHGNTESMTKEGSGIQSLAKRKREWKETNRAEEPDPKPKKAQRKRNAVEAERDAKLDSLVEAYKRKLAKGVKKVGSTSKAAGSGIQAPKARWFD